MACHQGARAALSFGYKNVYIMSAGIQGWQKAGKTVETGDSSACATRVAEPRPALSLHALDGEHAVAPVDHVVHLHALAAQQIDRDPVRAAACPPQGMR